METGLYGLNTRIHDKRNANVAIDRIIGDYRLADMPIAADDRDIPLSNSEWAHLSNASGASSRASSRASSGATIPALAYNAPSRASTASARANAPSRASTANNASARASTASARATNASAMASRASTPERAPFGFGPKLVAAAARANSGAAASANSGAAASGSKKYTKLFSPEVRAELAEYRAARKIQKRQIAMLPSGLERNVQLKKLRADISTDETRIRRKNKDYNQWLLQRNAAKRHEVQPPATTALEIYKRDARQISAQLRKLPNGPEKNALQAKQYKDYKSITAKLRRAEAGYTIRGGGAFEQIAPEVAAQLAGSSRSTVPIQFVPDVSAQLDAYKRAARQRTREINAQYEGEEREARLREHRAETARGLQKIRRLDPQYNEHSKQYQAVRRQMIRELDL